MGISSGLKRLFLGIAEVRRRGRLRAGRAGVARGVRVLFAMAHVGQLGYPLNSHTRSQTNRVQTRHACLMPQVRGGGRRLHVHGGGVRVRGLQVLKPQLLTHRPSYET